MLKKILIHQIIQKKWLETRLLDMAIDLSVQRKKDLTVNDLTLNNINQSFTMLMMLSIKCNLICFSTL